MSRFFFFFSHEWIILGICLPRGALSQDFSRFSIFQLEDAANATHADSLDQLRSSDVEGPNVYLDKERDMNREASGSPKSSPSCSHVWVSGRKRNTR